MKNNFSPSSNTASLFSWFVRHWKQLLAAIVILSAIAFACHKLYLFYPYLNLPHVTAADLDALDLDGYDKVMFCLLYTSPSPRDISGSRMPSSA